MNQQRKIIYEQRTEIIATENVEYFFTSMKEELVEKTILMFIPLSSYREDWNLVGLVAELHRVFSLKFDPNDIVNSDVTEKEIIEMINKQVDELYYSRKELFSHELMHKAMKYLLLTTLDQVWKDHLHNLDYLRQGISLRAYGQKDPLNEYKREAFNLFAHMLDNLKEMFIQRLCYLHIDTGHIDQESMSLEHKKLESSMRETREDPAFSKYNSGVSIETTLKPLKVHVRQQDRVQKDPTSWGKVSRNETCPCGSGKKYKYCHGNLVDENE